MAGQDPWAGSEKTLLHVAGCGIWSWENFRVPICLSWVRMRDGGRLGGGGTDMASPGPSCLYWLVCSFNNF